MLSSAKSRRITPTEFICEQRWPVQLLPQSDLNEWRKYDLHPKQVVLAGLVAVCHRLSALIRVIGSKASHLLAALFFGDPTLAAIGSQNAIAPVSTSCVESANAYENRRSMKLEYT